MNNPWVKILVFGLLFGIGGFLIGRCCGGGCHKGGCGKEAACHGKGACAEGEAGKDCCKGGGHHGGHGECGKGQGSCKGDCKGDCGGHCGGACGDGGKACCKGMAHTAAEAEAQAAVDRIKASDFQGDTTVKFTGGQVNIHKQGDKLEVMMELADSTHVAAGHGAHH